MSQIDLKNISKSWGDKPAVDGLNLSIANGELVALLGPSGCGKSTTLMMLAGIYAPTSGDILFDGERVNDVEPKDRNVGIVFQSYALYPNMSVEDNILFPLRFKGKVGENERRQAREMAELVEIGALLERRPAQLSGGQQQRVALARALIKRPNLLLLDEPLSNLDATLRMTMRTEIKRLQRELGVTTILVTHDQLEATTMADRVVCMNAGSIEQSGSADDLYLRPTSLFIAGFIGSPQMNLLPATAKGTNLACGSVQMGIAGMLEGDVMLGLRPEHLHFAEQGFAGEVIGVEPMGREVLYAVRTDLGVLRVLEVGALPRLQAGDGVKIAVDTDKAVLFDRTDGQRTQHRLAA
ncbi:Trehalose import ATP-binding protein SugC [Pseudovibrio axinellae]|uniref:Trehalose import ATP-binding protein SugC n=1 Tax=Pseudovibrio axinellae TaxID=989403 RepID=A0A165Y358_9HYPH|nr:ABC transporter ATP-binding protein [Pseudovibrio axinellae]KZL18390.1 Trehalose import ATP-binding protein SugC [Pseudovibrio axinellae]SER70608.1 inositol-phosphate transport system ATP-binding protein [Pseudovibrio axinellae]